MIHVFMLVSKHRGLPPGALEAALIFMVGCGRSKCAYRTGSPSGKCQQGQLIGKMAKDPITILVVESDENLREILAVLLEKHSLNVISAPDGLVAEGLIEQMPPPGLIFLGLKTRYEDGVEILAGLRNRPGWQDVPVVMLVSEAIEEHIGWALKAGANDWMVKPIQPAELMRCLKLFLDL